MLNTMLPVALLIVHTLITIIPGPAADAFGGMYHNQPIQSIVKSILSIGTLIVFLMAHEWMRRPDTAIKQGEFYVLTLSTLLGMYFLISAGHFLVFNIGLPSFLCASGLMKRSAMKRITITAISDSSSFINRNWE